MKLKDDLAFRPQRLYIFAGIGLDMGESYKMPSEMDGINAINYF